MNPEEAKQTLLKMVRIELEAMHYYQQISQKLTDQGAIYLFNLLAQEELEHARVYYAAYPDEDMPNLEELIHSLPQKVPELVGEGQESLTQLTERRALQLAMQLEQKVANDLRYLLGEAQSPAARAAIEDNIESTLAHMELIRQDYRRLFGETLPA